MITLADKLLSMPMLAAIHVYRWVVAPLLGTNCRYAPGCSEYAVEALRVHGGLRGSWLVLRRLSRCHPWGGHGFDPVPPRHAETGVSKAGVAQNRTDGRRVAP